MPRVRDWAWRSRSRSRANTAVRSRIVRAPATPCSPCCCRCGWKRRRRMAPEAPSAAARIWIVDDDRAVRFVLATALREAGYAVDGFENARDALEALGDRGAPALLFTDVRMPGEGGLVLLERLKAAVPDLPVIVMSAYTDIASTAG